VTHEQLQLWKMARELADEHGLTDWSVYSLDGDEPYADGRQFGVCVHETKTMHIDLRRASRWSKARQRDLVLHEIAHALTATHGHGEDWQATALRVGMRPSQLRRDLHNVETEELYQRIAGVK
jgi:hypothetical protein